MGPKKQVVFDESYYRKIMQEFGYDPIKFGQINFSLGNLTKEDLQRRWLCHHSGDLFATNLNEGKKVIVSTGFGLSGTPHAGTLSQILRAITLQKAGIPVNMVLGDLDAYNGKAKPLEYTLELAERYRGFVQRLGFDDSEPSILRSQYDSLEVLRTSYIIGHYMNDDMFREAEEDLHHFYTSQGKVDSDMSYRRKLSLNLMTADFIHLNTAENFDAILVMLGVDEHKYVQFGMQTIRNMQTDERLSSFKMTMGGLYSALIKGFYGYPKMSKSFPDSGITVDMSPDDIRRKIMEGEGDFDMPENNVVYQMMAAVSNLDAHQLQRNYALCMKQDHGWVEAKNNYTDMLIDICSKWE